MEESLPAAVVHLVDDAAEVGVVRNSGITDVYYEEAPFFVSGGDDPIVVGGDQKTDVVSKREDILSLHFYLYRFLRDHGFEYAFGLLVSGPKSFVRIHQQFVLQV